MDVITYPYPNSDAGLDTRCQQNGAADVFSLTVAQQDDVIK